MGYSFRMKLRDLAKKQGMLKKLGGVLARAGFHQGGGQHHLFGVVEQHLLKDTDPRFALIDQAAFAAKSSECFEMEKDFKLNFKDNLARIYIDMI